MEEVEEESCHKLEAGVVNLRKKVENSNTQIKFLNSSMILVLDTTSKKSVLPRNLMQVLHL
jgi:hypothetical protein